MKNILRTASLLAFTFASGCQMEDGSMSGGMPCIEATSFYGGRYTEWGENQFVEVSEQDVSTFGVDCDGASYTVMRRYQNHGQRPPVASVRLEEYINYFTFDYPEPGGGHNVSSDTEVSSCPWNADHLLMRVGLKGKTIAEEQLPATNYVFLIDVSGSMNSPDKLGILKSGFSMLVDELRAIDRVAIVTYAGYAQVALESTCCDNRQQIKKAIDKLGAGGSTAGAQGIITAYEIASANFIPGGNNRIIIGSDGDFNVGPSSTDELVELIVSNRDKGIHLTVLGVGGDNLNDGMMEQIANKGNGTYEYIDNADQLIKVFVHEKSRFHTIATDCKVQVTFNPTTVHSYRLLGYENRIMSQEDFEDDSKDSGDIGIGQTVTVLYELVPAATPATGNFARLEVRYKKPEAETSHLFTAQIDAMPVAIGQSSENMRFASSVAAWGMIMKESGFSGTADKSLVLQLGGNATSFDPHGYRSQFLTLVEKSRWKALD